MRERRRRRMIDGDAARQRVSGRPRPNHLSDAATPNVLAGGGESGTSNAVPSWIRAATAQRAAGQRTAASRRRPARLTGPAASDGESSAQSSPNLFTIVIVAFIVLSILRACLQLG